MKSAMIRPPCATVLDQATSNLRLSIAAVAAASHRHFLLPCQKPYSHSCIDSSAVAAAASHRHLLVPYQKPYSHSCIDSSDEQSSVTVSFLTGSCGFPADAARSIAQRVQLKSVEKAHSVVALLKGYSFSEAQIMVLVTRAPRVLTCHPLKNLKPKLEFYCGIGLVGAALAKILAANPRPLLCSLESRLLPNVKLLKSILATNEKVVAAINNSPTLIIQNFSKVVLPRIELLRADGVADDVISSLLTKYGDTFSARFYRFEETVDAIKKLGVPPSKLMFAHALGVFVKLPHKQWKKKVDTFRCLGWSEDQIMVAFARQPYIARVSTEKIRRNVKFLVEKLGWEPEYTSTYTNVIWMSLEKRLMPSYAVLHILVSRGLVKTVFSGSQFLMPEKKFLAKFMIPFQEEAPEIVDAFRGLKAFEQM